MHSWMSMGVIEKDTDDTETWRSAVKSPNSGPMYMGFFRQLHAYKEPLWVYDQGSDILSSTFDMSSRIADRQGYRTGLPT